MNKLKNNAWFRKVGMALLLGLMILATWNDLTRLFS